MNQLITITEYGAIGRAKKPTGRFCTASADEKCFEALKSFNAENGDEIFTLTMVRAEDGSRIEALKAKSFVGVIETKDGTVVEILPKIFDGEDAELDKTRAIFLGMLSCLSDTPFIEGGTARLLTEKMNIMEVFISMFLQELGALLQKGILREYVNVEENRSYLKGKLLFSKHIKANLVHKERFYISFDEFMNDRPENRLIKSTLRLLSLKAGSNENQKRIREFLFTFDEVPYTENTDIDFQKIKSSRLSKHYDKALAWCRVFLKNKSFTNFKGESVAFSLLFPMEKIFEDFVGTLIRRDNPDSDVFLQHRKHHLIADHDGTEMFSLRPDIVLRKSNDQFIILDTKWKLIDQNNQKDNYLISQNDFYQMFAYGEKYGSAELYLLYPRTKNFTVPITAFNFYKEKSMSLNACPIDLARAVENRKISYKDISA